MAGDPTNVMDVTEAAYRAGYEAAERDLAQARAEAARMKAALATVLCVDADEDGGVLDCGEEYDGHITRCVNCEARDVGEAL